MLVRPWDRDKDYDTLVKWWTQWEFGVVPKECLPVSYTHLRAHETKASIVLRGRGG